MNTLEEALDLPQLDHLNLVCEMETEDGPIRFADNPISIVALDLRREPMPGLGEDTEAILAALGRTEDEIERLAAEGVV